MQGQVGRFQLVESLARGGGGEVFRALDPRSGGQVALKVLHQQGRTTSRRLEREAESLLRLDHPHVVSVIEVGEHQGSPFIAMELLSESLAERLQRAGPLRPTQAADLARKLALALAYAHRCGLLHRDLKPSNVLFTADGEPKLADFGLALDVDTSQSRITRSGAFLGTPGYWAPEQAQGARDAQGPHTDVYGLGATLFAALTGMPPHQAESLHQALAMSLQPAPLASSLNPEVDRALDAIVARCLSLEPGERYPDGDALARALAGYLAGPAGRAPEGGGRRAALVVLLPLVLLGGVSAWALWPRAPEPRPSVAEVTPLEAAAGQLAEGEFEALLATLARVPGAEAAELRGVALVWLERWADAERELLQVEPATARSLSGLGAAQQGQHRTAEAWETLRAVPQGERDTALHGYALALVSQRQNLPEEALPALQRARRRYPELPGPRELEVDLLLLDARGWEALEAARAWGTAAPESSRARLLELQVLAELGLDDEANHVLDEALRDFPDDPRVRMNLAVRAIHAGDSVGAARILAELLAEHPDDTELLIRQAQRFYAEREFAAGHAVVARILELEPGHVEARWQRAIARDTEVGTQLALPDILDVVRDDSRKLSRVVSSAGRMRAGGEDPALVDRMLREVVAGAPRRGAALVRLGRSLLLESEFPAAEEAFRRGRLEEPVLGARGLAMALVAQGREEEARVVLAELETQPPSPLRDVSLAHVYARLGRDGEATRLLEATQGARLQPNEEEALRVSLLLGRRRLQPALELARRHVEEFPEHPRAHLLLARVLANVAADLDTRGRAADSLDRKLELEALLVRALERGVGEGVRLPMQRLLARVREHLPR